MYPQEAPAKKARVYSMPNDDKYWWMLAWFVFVTPQQAIRILGQIRVSVYVRLRRLHEGEYLGRPRPEDLLITQECVYWLTKKGAEQAIERGYLNKKWCVYKKSLQQVPHDIGTTDCQIVFYENFPAMECRRWRADLQKDFSGEVPDLFFDLKDGVGWCPFEYERLNPITLKKLREYARSFERTYVVVQTEKRLDSLLTSIEDSLPTTKLWFTTRAKILANPKGTIWWTPANFRERQYSILKPER